MTAWDGKVFSDALNEDFLEDLNTMDEEDIVEAVTDACRVVVSQDNPSEEELANGLAAATIAAIWAGAPYYSGEIIERYPYIRDLIGETFADLSAMASEILESVDAEEDVDTFLEALA
ncbi:DUF4259 domain-containing protein [Corynebacterium caspium]|uniref:DUF4259 domain-containing protein n=1 Tax=Corynebacterium caspium TaxID=234828 RepID=UPI00036AFFB5|nr:DUF4259 domain-containing protein [Corynebacterium caspium]WKD59716.1 hypothetical protein CCASP_06685 [Corynebacterium caspium DSM 44850]